MFGTDVSHVINGVDAATTAAAWVFDVYSDNTGKTITFNMGGWFDASTLSRWHIFVASKYLVPAGGFAMQLSEDGTNWYNMPDASSSANFGYNDQTVDFTPWPDNTNFKYIRFIGTGGSYDFPAWIKSHGYLSYLAYYSTIAFLQGDGTPLTVDTVTVPNPHPPTGDPDTDDGASNPPAPAGDSGVPAQVSSAEMTVTRSDPGAVDVSSSVLLAAASDAGAVRTAGVSLLVMSKAPKSLAVSFADESAFNVTMTGGTPVVSLAVSFNDEAVFNAVAQVLVPIDLAVTFNDGSVFELFSSLDVIYGQQSSYNTGKA